MEEVSYLFSSFFPFFFIGVFAFLIPRIQAGMFKELKESFQSNESFPAENFRISQMQYGKIKLNNAAKIAETIQGLYLRIPFRTVLHIPFGEISEVKIKDSFFGQKALIIKFKKSGISPLSLSVTKATLKQLPNLLKTIGHGPMKALPKASTPQTFNPSQNPFMLSGTSNVIRGTLLIATITAGIAAATIWYLVS